jgi:nucleotide-binding universal stress UspA family protein
MRTTLIEGAERYGNQQNEPVEHKARRGDRIYVDPDRSIVMLVVAAISRSPGAERVVSEAVTLSERIGADLHVVHVAGQYETSHRVRIDADERAGKPVEVTEDKDAREYASEVAGAVTDAYTPVGLVGYPAAEIRNYAAKQDATYLVIGGRKRSPVGKVLFGSTTQAVLLGADRPVLVIPEPGESVEG